MYRLSFAALISIFLLASCERPDAETVVITGSSTIAPLVADAADRYMADHPGVRIEVQSGGSSRGVADAISGIADIGMVSRALKEDEPAKLTAHTIAADGVCVIVHQDNPVQHLEKDQLIGIYTKKITNWQEVGGKDAAIVVANKAEGRSTLEIFLHFLNLDSSEVKADVVVGENLHVIKSVVGNPNAIGYVSIGTATADEESGTPIKRVLTGGVEPTMDSVRDGTFPITRPLNVVTDAQTSPAAQAFLDYLMSTAIHDLVEKHFFVPVR